MISKDFVKATICNLDQSVFEKLKQLLIGEYISFSIIDNENVTVEILAEKVCDYFDTLELKTGKSLYEYLLRYLSDLKAIVGPHIDKIPQTKRGNRTPVVVPRSRKYFEKAVALIRGRGVSFDQMYDCSRIMLCLYATIIKNDRNHRCKVIIQDLQAAWCP